MAPVEELLEEARRLHPSSTEGRFRLGEIVEALRRQLPRLGSQPLVPSSPGAARQPASR